MADAVALQRLDDAKGPLTVALHDIVGGHMQMWINGAPKAPASWADAVQFTRDRQRSHLGTWIKDSQDAVQSAVEGTDFKKAIWDRQFRTLILPVTGLTYWQVNLNQDTTKEVLSSGTIWMKIARAKEVVKPGASFKSALDEGGRVVLVTGVARTG